jgi:hypothetical protein
MLGTQCWGEECLYAFGGFLHVGNKDDGTNRLDVGTVVPPPLPFQDISQTTEHREWSRPTLWLDPFPRILVLHLKFIIVCIIGPQQVQSHGKLPLTRSLASQNPEKTNVLL